jgi:hypothetical protein
MSDEKQFVINEKRSNAISRSRKKRELYQVALADIDVRAAIAAADDFIALLDRYRFPGDKLPYHLSDAFVAYIAVAYARPFNPGRRSATPALPPRWGKFEDKNLQTTHDMMLDVRHTMFAHSDPKDREMTIIPAGCSVRGRIAPRTSLMVSKWILPPTVIGELRATCVNLQKRLEKRITTLMEELYGEMDLPGRTFRVRFDEGL